MKNLILALLPSIFLIFGCKKDDSSNNNTSNTPDVFVEIKLNGIQYYTSTKDVDSAANPLETNYFTSRLFTIPKQLFGRFYRNDNNFVNLNFAQNTSYNNFVGSYPFGNRPPTSTGLIISSINSVQYSTNYFTDTSGYFLNIQSYANNRISGNFSCKFYKTIGNTFSYEGILSGEFRNIYLRLTN